jgi:hypothetical protein
MIVAQHFSGSPSPPESIQKFANAGNWLQQSVFQVVAATVAIVPLIGLSSTLPHPVSWRRTKYGRLIIWTIRP